MILDGARRPLALDPQALRARLKDTEALVMHLEVIPDVDDELVRGVRHGRGGMPAIPSLRSDAEARALVAFVRILSPGFELYSRHCASCHGDDGHPQREFIERRQRPTVVFDRQWLARRDPAQLRAAVSHMLEEREPGMPHFRRTLSEPEARAIVRYLRGAP